MPPYHQMQLSYLGVRVFFTQVAWLQQSFIIYSISIASFVAGCIWQPPLQFK